MKHLISLDDNSILLNCKRTASQLKIIVSNTNEIVYDVKILCTYNPNLKLKSFAEQLIYELTRFFKEPFVLDETLVKELIDNQIIKVVRECFAMCFSGNTIVPNMDTIQKTIGFEHGTNGCSNIKVLMQSAKPAQLYSTNIFQYLTRRERG